MPDKQVLLQNFDKRGWAKSGGEEDWNIYWALPLTLKTKIFNPDTGHRLGELQLLNHFPYHEELTRKDLMVKNIKRYRRDLEKENNPLAEKDEQGRYVHLDIIPATYIFPENYSIFVEEFKRNPPKTMWIMKPAGRAQGSGIFLVDKLQ